MTPAIIAECISKLLMPAPEDDTSDVELLKAIIWKIAVADDDPEEVKLLLVSMSGATMDITVKRGTPL